MYEYTKDDFWKEKARKQTELLEQEKWNGSTHDMGFKMYCSYGNGYRLTQDSGYKDILLQSAYTLIRRYNPKVGCIRSWDHNRDKWQYPVIIDNMMNLELLFWAFRTNGDSIFYQVAVDHARPAQSCIKTPIRGIPMLRLGRVDKRGDCTAIRCAIEKLDCLNFWNVPNKLPLIFSPILHCRTI